MNEIGLVCTDNRKTRFFQVEAELVFAHRIETYSHDCVVHETFANNWFVGFLVSSGASLQIRSGQKRIELSAPKAILVPPYSLLEWHLGRGQAEWSGFFSKLPFSKRPFQLPTVFSFDGVLPKTALELADLIERLHGGEEIGVSRDNSWLSSRIKEFIDMHYREDMKVEDIAKKLNSHRSFLARSFKKSYGISPVEYRHKLRVFEGLKKMNQEHQEVTTAAVESGFSSIQRFEEHFKDLFEMTPSQFNFSRLKR